MTKYLETKRNSIEEAISSVVLGENGFVVGKVKMPKMKGGAKLQSKTNFDFRLFDPEDSPGSDKANDEMNREIVKASKMKDKQTAMAHMSKIQRKHSKHGATDTEPREVISQVLNRVFGESVEIDEKFSITLPPTRGGKKLLNIDMGRAIRMLKDFGATKSDIRNVLSGKGGRFQNAGGEMFFVQREGVELDEAKYEVQYTVSSRVGDSRSRTKSRLSKIDIDARSKDDAEKKFFKQAEKSPMMRDAMRRDMLDVVYVGLKESLDEGYESEVLKVLKDADIEGYFKMGKLYVSRRDAKDAKKALEDSDEITKLPKMVMEDERMKKLTPRQRQALARVQAKPKSQVSLPKMPDFMKLKKEEVEMNINEKIEYVEYEFKNRGDAMKAKRYFDGIQLMNFDVNDDNIGRGQLMVDAGNRDMTRYHKEVMKNFKPKVMTQEKLDPVNKDAVKKKFDDRKDKDIDNDGDVDSTDKYLHKRRKAISKAIKNEVYDIGKDYAQHTLEVTPGQDKKDVDKMLNTAYTKNQSMREALAKVWGIDEGKSPFQKEEEKPLTKTMTGQKPTKVMVEPKMEKK